MAAERCHNTATLFYKFAPGLKRVSEISCRPGKKRQRFCCHQMDTDSLSRFMVIYKFSSYLHFWQRKHRHLMAAKPPPLFLRPTRNFQNALHAFSAARRCASAFLQRRRTAPTGFAPPLSGKKAASTCWQGERVVSAARTQHVAPPRAYARACA